MPPEPRPTTNAAALAAQLAGDLSRRHIDYAIGGAIALGYWAIPRGTLDVDVTLFLPPDQPSAVLALLADLGCHFSSEAAAESLREHGFCRAAMAEMHVDVFLPIVPFYQEARARRRQVVLAGQEVMIWDAETIAVFKMMFFRRKDVADVEQILRSQGKQIDREWVGMQLAAMYGSRDPRLAQWKELLQEVPPT